MIKLAKSRYHEVFQRRRRVWPKYSTQLLNIAAQNAKAFDKNHLGAVVNAFQKMRESGKPGTLSNWESYYNENFGEERILTAGKKIHDKLIQMQIHWISLDMCIDYAKEVTYNKTHMGSAGQEMAVEVAAKYFEKEFRWPTIHEDTALGIDAWIGDIPVQVKPQDSAFKGHVHNHPNMKTHLLITYMPKEMSCIIHNPEIMVK